MNIEERNRVVEQHYRKNYERLVIQRRNQLGYRSEDAVQEAYARALHYWDSFDANLGSFDSWFAGILKNARTHEFKDMKHWEAVEEPDYERLRTSATQYPRMRLQDIQKHIEGYPLDVQRCLRMALVERYSHIEIHQVLPLSLVNIKQLIHRFRVTLREAGV